MFLMSPRDILKDKRDTLSILKIYEFLDGFINRASMMLLLKNTCELSVKDQIYKADLLKPDIFSVKGEKYSGTKGSAFYLSCKFLKILPIIYYFALYSGE